MIPSSRRQFLATVAGAATLARRGKSTPSEELRFAGFDHVSLAVDDVPRSVAFYSRLFGNTVLKDSANGRCYLKLGPSYLAISQPSAGQGSHRVDHICAGMPAFDQAAVKALLEARGLKPRDGVTGLMVTDPDGIQVQLWIDNSWNSLPKTTAPLSVPAPTGQIFNPTGLNHILLQVSEPEKSAAFYEKIFGPIVQRAPSPPRIWFQAGTSRLGLCPLPAGGKPAVNHFCVAAAPFDFASAMKQILRAGATEAPLEVVGWPEFYDPEGILVQVMMPRTPVTGRTGF